MADMAEYYHQISEIQKAVRERELHRLELEKQRLRKTHRREKRYEELQDKIKELHRELVQEELEAKHRFQNLLAQVDALRREHQLLESHTERLKQKKCQYEMQLAKTNPGFQYPLQGGQYQNFRSSVGATTGIVPQAARTKNPSFPQAQPNINPQYHISLLNSSQPSSSTHLSVQQPGFHSPSEQINPHKFELQPMNVAGTPLPVSNGQHKASGIITNPQTSGGTNSILSLPPTSGATQFIDPSMDFTCVRNLNLHTNLLSTSVGHTQAGEASLSISQAQNTPVISNDSKSYDVMTHPQNSQDLHMYTSEMQSSSNVTPGTQEVISQQGIFNPNYLPTEKLHIAYPQLQEYQCTESLQKPISSIQSIQMETVSNHTHLLNKQGSPSSGATYSLSMTPAGTLIHGVPVSAKISDSISVQASSDIYQINMHSDKSSTHTTPSVTRFPVPTGSESLTKKTTDTHPPITQTTNESAHHGTPIKDVREEVSHSPEKHFEQDLISDTESIHVKAEVKPNTPDALNSQPSLHHENFSQMHKALDIRKQNAEIGETELDIMCESGRVDKNWREVKEKSFVGNRDTNINAQVSCRITSAGIDHVDKELATREDHGTGSESTPVINDVAKSPAQHLALDNSSAATISATHVSLNKEISHNSNSFSFSKITSNDNIATSPQAKHVSINSSASMDHKLKETRWDTLQSPGIYPEETHQDREDETSKLPHHSPLNQHGSSVADFTKKLNVPLSNTGSSKNDSSKISLAGSTATKASQLKLPLQDQDEDNDSDFFDRDVSVTASAAYKSLVGDTKACAEASLDTESESDDVEGHISTILSKEQTQITRSALKPFASSVPTLRPPPPGTDTDSVDSVEAAIQATLNINRDSSSNKSKVQEPQESPSPKATSPKANLLPYKENIKPGVRDGSKLRPSAALQLNLESDSESYGVSAGGEASDEDDFDFYDKF